jgi:hypothetical protein
MSWFFAILSALFVIASIPIDGPAGIALAVAGVVSAIASLRLNPARKGRTR